MFDKYKILEYLLLNTFNNERKSYTEVYAYFEVGSDEDDDEIPYEHKKSVPNFLNAMEIAESRIVREIRNNDIVPIYTNFIYRTVDNLPGIGFYEIFYNRNRILYKTIAGNLNVHDVFDNPKMKKEIFDKSMEILASDIKDRFPNQDDIEEFLAEVKLYKDI